ARARRRRARRRTPHPARRRRGRVMSNTKPISALRAVVSAAALLAGANGALADDAVPTYTARYQVEYKGRDVGESVQSLERDGEGYRFRSETQARGIARLLRPRPLVEESVFELRDGAPRPLEFR